MANQGINFSALVYGSCMDTFAIDVTFMTTLNGTFINRGIFTTRELNVLAENNSIYSDQQTILDIRESEFPIMPVQGDHVMIDKDCNGAYRGEFVIVDSSDNGGGETTLTLRKLENLIGQ
jgi:hypothetical protein